jgi:hypothetical protein
LAAFVVEPESAMTDVVPAVAVATPELPQRGLDLLDRHLEGPHRHPLGRGVCLLVVLALADHRDAGYGAVDLADQLVNRSVIRRQPLW